ncbi:hypothetical protein ABZ438_37420 [Streptomyces sp. NPDC005786]|uniref:hypothetical protein n=1 Tax=Streptomyces sp. NPDC005786 TaxID=3154891 RepID=UPI0033E25E82
MALVGCSSTTERLAGSALDGGIQSNGTVGSDHVKIGEEWWAAFPVPFNASAQRLEITGAELASVPEGLKVIEYGAYDRRDTDGFALLSKQGSPGMPKFDKLKNHIGEANGVSGKSESAIYYLARLKVTGPIHANVTGCEFKYRQGSREYTQTLECDVALRLETA